MITIKEYNNKQNGRKNEAEITIKFSKLIDAVNALIKENTEIVNIQIIYGDEYIDENTDKEVYKICFEKWECGGLGVIDIDADIVEATTEEIERC